MRYLKVLCVDSLKNLTLKVTMLMALITARRAQTLHALKLSDMMLSDLEIIFHISVQLKTQPVGSELRFEKFSDLDLCIVRLMCKYNEETKGLVADDQLLVSFVRPHGLVSCDTVRRWILSLMADVGGSGCFNFQTIQYVICF